MKKLASLLLAVCMCLSIGVMFTACKTEGGGEQHTHTYKTEWSKDPIYHWHVCETAGCTEISEKSEHTWNDGEITTEATADTDGVKTFTCTACGQIKTEIINFTDKNDNDTENLDYTLSDDGTYYTVSGIGSYKNSNLIIPDTYNDLPVTAIDSGAFYDCYNITSVCIGNNVENIGPDAFSGCIGLTSVVIPDNVKSIGMSAFEFCANLVSVTIGESVESIGHKAFNLSKLVEIINKSDLDLQVGSDGYDYGYVTRYAKEVHSGESKIVNDNDYLFYTFNGVNYLLGYVGNDTHLVLPKNYKDESYEIYERAFYDTVARLGNYICYSDLRSVVIPVGVTSIGVQAFNNCLNLTTVIIDSDVSGLSVGSSAFGECIRLVEVINKSELNITAGSYDLGGLAQYAKEVHSGSTKIIEADEYIFYTHNGVNYLINYTGSEATPVLPENYNGNSYELYSTFLNNRNITGIIIPNGVTNIGERAFSGCRSLSSLTIANSVTSIGEYSISGCWSLESLSIPNSVTSIGTHAFFECIKLTDISIPDSVKSIGAAAFRYCTNLDGVVIPNSVLDIGERAFHSCTSLKSIMIPNSVTAIREETFYSCTGLVSVILPDRITKIEKDAFGKCASLTDVTIPDSITPLICIDVNAFNNNSYNVYDSAYYLGNRDNPYLILVKAKFDVHSGEVTQNIIHTDTKIINEGAFYGCGFTSITIPDGVVSIGDYAFSGCYTLEEIVIPDSIMRIGNSAFKYCANLSCIYIPKGLTSIGSNTFEDCARLTSVYIPDSVTSIEANAFWRCPNLTNVYYTGSESSWRGILISPNNDQLADATIHYNYVSNE